MAGCARAVAIIKAVMVRIMVALVARHPRVNLDVCVDDVEIQVVGTRRIVAAMSEAVKELHQVFTEELGFPLE